MIKIVLALGILIFLVYDPLSNGFFNFPPKAAAQVATESDVLQAVQPVKTISAFEQKIATESAIIKRKTIYKDNPDREIDDNQVLEEGSDGKQIDTYKILVFQGEEYSRELIDSKTIAPEDKIVAKGTKIVWRTIDTPDGQITYWKKLQVYATQYDSHCPGCDDWTAIGMHAGKGVIAVDPSVIKLKSQVYIPGYGKAIAGDTGGSIIGNKIDVGFPDAHTSGWYSHFVDIYLL